MRRAVAGLALALSLAAFPQAVVGLIVWTFVLTPLTVTAGQATVFTMTATNMAGPDDLGCLRVTLPTTFTISSIGDPVASNGEDWQATLSSSTLRVQSLSGGGRLEIGESVTFQVTATATAAGVTSWANRAHRHQDCSGVSEFGVPAQVVVLPAMVATPAPTARPTATPRPSPTPSALPSLPVTIPPLPSLLPSPSSGATARPTVQPSDRPATATPSSSPDASPSLAPGGEPVGPTRPGGSSGPPSSLVAPAPRVVPPDAGPVQVGGGTLSVLDGFDTWSVPAAVVGVPGLLVVLWVALQTVGALAWIPVVRRFRREHGHASGNGGSALR